MNSFLLLLIAYFLYLNSEIGNRKSQIANRKSKSANAEMERSAHSWFCVGRLSQPFLEESGVRREESARHQRASCHRDTSLENYSKSSGAGCRAEGEARGVRGETMGETRRAALP